MTGVCCDDGDVDLGDFGEFQEAFAGTSFYAVLYPTNGAIIDMYSAGSNFGAFDCWHNDPAGRVLPCHRATDDRDGGTVM